MSKFNTVVLHDDPTHKFLLLGWEEQEEDGVVQTNQYMILHGDEVVLLDPGGAHVFPRVLANVAEVAPVSKISHIFYSHQDPDVSSGVTLWLSIAERAQVHISGLWTRFLPHFGIYDTKRITAIPDQGGQIALHGGAKLDLIPSHFMHSTGCFSVYDPISKILFSGDIGAAIFPKNGRYPVSKSFDDHLKLMEGFHKRYMASNVACRKWVDMIATRQIAAIAPQHGAVMQGDQVPKFLNWLKDLKCGVDLIDSFYGRGSTLQPVAKGR